MTTPDEDFYAKRIQAVLRYMGSHLDEELTVERLSEVAGFSKFHFHRQFRIYAGLNVGKLIGLLRLKRASIQLALHTDRLIDVALDAGFASPEAFARAFRRAQGQSPSEFRGEPDWERWTETFFHTPNAHTGSPMHVDLISFPATPVAVLEHQGPPSTLMASVKTFVEWRKSSDVSPEATSATYGVPYSDPEATDPQAFRFDICGATLRGEVPHNPQGVVLKELPPGRCAVTRHVGSTDRIGETVHRLYREWLPASGERLRDFPVFFHYIERMPRVSELEQITDVYLPLAGAD